MTDERIEGLIARAEAWVKQTAAIDKAPIDLVGDMLAQLRADHPAPSSLARQIMRGLERGAQRTPQDYAIEFGGYLADRAVTFLRLMEEPDMGADNPDHQAEVYRALRSAVYEFRKRAARCAPDVHIAVGPEAVDEVIAQMPSPVASAQDAEATVTEQGGGGAPTAASRPSKQDDAVSDGPVGGYTEARAKALVDSRVASWESGSEPKPKICPTCGLPMKEG
jgi:hypothetical protein